MEDFKDFSKTVIGSLARIETNQENIEKIVLKHDKLLYGNGSGWGIKAQTRILWTLLIGGLGLLGLRIF